MRAEKRRGRPPVFHVDVSLSAAVRDAERRHDANAPLKANENLDSDGAGRRQTRWFRLNNIRSFKASGALRENLSLPATLLRLRSLGLSGKAGREARLGPPRVKNNFGLPPDKMRFFYDSNIWGRVMRGKLNADSR